MIQESIVLSLIYIKDIKLFLSNYLEVQNQIKKRMKIRYKDK